MFINEIFFWDHLSKHEFPGKFEGINGGHSHVRIDINGATNVNVALCYPLTYALYDYILMQNKMLLEDHIAAGSASDGKGSETVYVEFQKKGQTYTQLISYNPSTGLIKGAVHDAMSLNISPYYLDGKDVDIASGKAPLGEAIFMAFFVAGIISDLGLEKYYERIVEDIKTNNITDKTAIDLAYINGEIYYAIKEERYNLDPGKKLSGKIGSLKPINQLDIDSGKVGPQKGKKFFETDFLVFKEEVKKTKKKMADVDFNKYKDYPFVKPITGFSKEELALIPKEDKNFTPTEEFVRVLDYMYDTKDDGVDAIKQVMLTGGPGGGKSTIGVQVGHYLGGGRPTLTFTCGSNYTSDELKGMLLPCPKGDVEGLSEQEQELLNAIKTSTIDNIFENSCKALGLPTNFECFANPSGAYKKIVGFDKPKEVEEDEVSSLLANRVTQAQKEVTEKAMELAKDNKEIEYKYMPSNIVIAMTKGYILVLDELTNMRDPAALSDLHEALDVASHTRRISTPIGDYFVHPDFRCITTANIGLEGNKRMNQATLNRLAQVLVPINDPSKEVLFARVKNRTGISDNTLISQCIDVYVSLRDAASEMRLPGVISPRDLFCYTRAIARGMDPVLATNEFLVYKLTQDSLSEDNEELRDFISDCELLM